VEQRLRARSFIWPTVEVVVGLAVIGGFILVHRRRRHEHEGGVGGEADPSPTGPVPTADRDGPRRFGVGPGSVAGFVLLICETLFLVTAGAPLFSSSSSYFVATPSVTALQRDVGSSEVGLGPNPYLCLGLGIIANANDVFDVHELAIYDPTMPKRYFDSFQQETGQSAGFPLENEYCPALTSSSSARLYGVAYVLESRGAPGLAGSTFVAQLGDEDLYHVAGSYPATLSPVLADGSLPAATAEGSQVHVGHPTPATWKMHVDASTAQVLRLRLADVPGWHASIDGKPLSLEPFSGIMLQARIPPGDHTVELSYWPTTFTLGIILGVCAFVGLCAALIIDGARRRRRQDRGATPAGSAP
jgi:hypothetical protein